MKTVDKDENGILTPFIMTAYKASIQRNLELSFSSEGDPASVTLTFDLMEDQNGNILDMVEITGDTMSVGLSATSLVKGKSTADIRINNAVGTVTAVVKDSSDAAATKVRAAISGDNDTVIVSADSDATAGTYYVNLTDSASNSAKITVVVKNS